MKTVIICGGIGTKMWPLSRQKMPKQFLPLIDGKSIFQLNWEALRLKFEPEDIFLQTNEYQAKIAKDQAPEILDENIFIEPEMRNQGPATGFCAAMLYKRFPDEPFMLVQADVLRNPASKFIEMIEEFEKLIRKEGKLVTGGIRPKRGIAGIDFMIPGEKIENTGEINIYKMKKLVMRDDPERDEGAIEAGEVFGHANHYAWTPRLMLEAFKRRAPEWYEPLMNIINGADVATEYAKMPKDPIEVRVTKYEMNDGFVVECPFEWVDLGTWESLDEYLRKENLYKNDNVLEIEGENNFVSSKKFTAVIGLSDVEIIETDDAILVVKKDKSGKVGEVVDFLKQKNPDLL